MSELALLNELNLNGSGRPCLKCSERGRFMCQRCMDYYCSRNCQLADWHKHKTTCFPIPNLIPFDEIDNRRIEVPFVAAAQPTSVKQQQTITVVKNDVIRPVVATEPMMIKKTTPPEPLKAMRPPNQKIEVVEPPPPPQKETTTAAEKPLMNKMNGISGKNAKTAPATPNEQADKSPLLPPRLSASLLNPPTQKGPRAGLPNKLAATLMSPPPQAWEKHFPLDDGGNELLDVIVQHSATSGFQSIHWVQLAKHESECTKLLQGINRLINEASKPCEATDIVLNRVYAVPFDEVFYRAVCLRPLDARNVATFRLIDYGNEVSVPLAHIHPSNPLMCNLNAFAFQIMLQPDRPIEIGEQLRIKLVKEQATENGIYMVEEEQPAVVEKVAAAAVVEEVQSKLVPMEKLPLPLDVETKMYVWDLNDLVTSGRAVVSVLDTERIRFIQERMPAKLHEYCSSLSSMKMYWPAVGEICLAVFDDDGQWYRAECIDRDEKSEMLSLLFVDYGNTTMTHSKFVRPISDEIRSLSPVIVHNCTISGVPKIIPPKVALNYLTMNPVFVGRAQLDANGDYLVQLNMDKV